jgi:hypothetical protein
MEALDRMTNSDQRKDPRFPTLQQANFHKPTIQHLRFDLFEIEEDSESKKERVEIESLPYFEVFYEIKLTHLIPLLLEKSQHKNVIFLTMLLASELV